MSGRSGRLRGVSEEIQERRGCMGRLMVWFVVVLLGGFGAAL